MEALTSIYSPETRNCGQKVKLGTIDQIAPRVYITMYIFWGMRPNQSIRETHASFGECLRRTLHEIPQLTTTIRPCNNGRDEVELAYDRTRGCIYTYRDYATTPERRALWPHGSIEELREKHHPYSACEKHLLLTPVEEYEYPPSFAMQINFIPGGYIVTSMLSHVVGDGTANYLFWQTMSKHMQAMSNGERHSPGPTSISFCERTDVVEPDNEGLNMDEFPNWRYADPEKVHVLPVKPQEEVETIPKAQYAIFYISEEKMKALADFISTEEIKISAVEAIGSFLWQQITLARDIDVKRYPEAKLSITVDLRRCMDDPVLPTNYWGNFSEPNAVARIPTQDLLQAKHTDTVAGKKLLAELLGEACDRIRNAVIAVDGTSVRRLVGLLNQMPKSNTLTWNVDRWPGPDMLLVCVNFHHYYALKFGPTIGEPNGGRFMIGDPDGSPDGRMLLCPPRPEDGKGLEIALQYDTATIERLQASPEFKKYFIRRC